MTRKKKKEFTFTFVFDGRTEMIKTVQTIKIEGIYISIELCKPQRHMSGNQLGIVLNRREILMKSTPSSDSSTGANYRREIIVYSQNLLLHFVD